MNVECNALANVITVNGEYIVLMLLVFSSGFQLYTESRWSSLEIYGECHPPETLYPNGVNAWLPSLHPFS